MKSHIAVSLALHAHLNTSVTTSNRLLRETVLKSSSESCDAADPIEFPVSMRPKGDALGLMASLWKETWVGTASVSAVWPEKRIDSSRPMARRDSSLLKMPKHTTCYVRALMHQHMNTGHTLAASALHNGPVVWREVLHELQEEVDVLEHDTLVLTVAVLCRIAG